MRANLRWDTQAHSFAASRWPPREHALSLLRCCCVAGRELLRVETEAMFYSTNLSREASTLTKWLVSIPSVAHAKGPSLINQAIYEGLREFPYFKNHPEHLSLIPHVDTNFDDEDLPPRHTKSSVVALVKSLEEVSDTLVLLCDTDTSSPYHYGMFKGSSTSCDDLALKLRQLAEQGAVSSKIEEILKSDSGLFGLGILESKCATGAMIAVLKELSDNYVHLNLNILFVCTCESSIQHRGIKQCIPFIEQLCHNENLALRLAVNAKPNTPVNRQDRGLHLYSGSYGKIEPSFYIIGSSATAFRPYDGFSASIIASELIRELELNPKLTQRLHHKPLVPTFDSLRVKEFGKDFSPDGMQVSFSLPLLDLNLGDLLEILKEVAATAIEHAAELVDHRESSYAQLMHEDFIPEAKDAEVISFSDLVERARHNFSGNLDKALSGMVQKCRHEGLSLHQASITIIERLNEIARLPRPSIVIYYTDNYVPPMSLEPSASKDRELFMLLEGLLARMHDSSPFNPTLVPYYAPTDGNFLRPVGHEAAFNTLSEECPVRAQELTTLNVPTITIGIQGDDLTQLTEHVTRDMCEYLPKFLLNLVDLLAQPENALGLAYHSDVEHQLAELGRRAESIANASVREIQTINQQNASTGFYAQVNQGTLTPHSLSTFLRQFQQGEPSTLQRQEAQLSLPLNPDASKDNSAEFTPETELITVTPAEVVVTQPTPQEEPEAKAEETAPQELQLELKPEEEAKSVKGNKAVRAVKSLFKKAQEAKQALEDNIQESSVEQAADAPISLVAGHHYKGTNKPNGAAPTGPSAIDVALEAASAIAQMANPDQPDPSTQEPADIDRLAPFTHAPQPEAKPEAKPLAESKSEVKTEAKPEAKSATKPEVKVETQPEAKSEAKPDLVAEPSAAAEEDESAALIVTPVASVVAPATEATSAEPKSKQAKGKKKKKGAKRKEATELKTTPQAAKTKPTSAEAQAAAAESARAKAPTASTQLAAADTKPAAQPAQVSTPEPAVPAQQPAASKAEPETPLEQAQPEAAAPEASAPNTETEAVPAAAPDKGADQPQATPKSQPDEQERADASPKEESAVTAPEPKAEHAEPKPQAESAAAPKAGSAASASTQDTEQQPELVAPTTESKYAEAQATESDAAQAAPVEDKAAEHQPEEAQSAEQATEPSAQDQHDQPEDVAKTESITESEPVEPTKDETKDHAAEDVVAPEPETPADAPATSKGAEPASEAQPVDLTDNKGNLAPEDFFAALAAAPVAAKTQAPAEKQAEPSTSGPSGFFAQALAATTKAPEPAADNAAAPESAQTEETPAVAESEEAAVTATAPEVSEAETQREPESAPESGAETTLASDTELAPESGTETAVESAAEITPESGAEVAPESGAEVAPESGAEVAPESSAEVASESDAEITSESGAETAPESGAEIAPESDSETAPESGDEITPESGAEVAPESVDEITPESGAKITSESGAEVTPESGAEIAPESGAEVTSESGADTSASGAAQEATAEEKRDDSNLGSDLKSAVDSIESALSSSLSKVSSFFKGKSKLKSSLNKLQEQVKETIEQEKPKAEHHSLTSPEPELNLEQVTGLGAQDSFAPVAPTLPESQAIPLQAAAPILQVTAAAAEQQAEVAAPAENTEPQAEATAEQVEAAAQVETTADQAESAVPAQAGAELDENLERELEALVETESAAATDAVIAALHQDDDNAKTIKVVAPTAPAFDLAKLTTAQVPEPDISSSSGHTIITRGPQIKPSKPVFISAQAVPKAPTEAKPDPTESKPAPTEVKLDKSKTESAQSKESKAKPEVSADMVAQLMAEAVSKKFKEHKLAQIDSPRSYSDSNKPFANGVYANDINVDLPSSQIFDPTSDTALEADALSQELQGEGSGSLQVPASEQAPGFAPDADAEPIAVSEPAQVPLNQLFAQAQKELQGSAVARHLRGAHEPFAPDAPEQALATHPEFAPDRDAEPAAAEPSADELIAATRAPQAASKPQAAPEPVAAPVQPQVKAELDAELNQDAADGPALKRYDPAQAYAELLLDDDEQYQKRVVSAQEQKAQAAAQRATAKQQALDAATATALGDMMNDDFSAQPSTQSASAATSRRAPTVRRTSSESESLSARRAALRRAMYGDDAELAPRKSAAPAPAAAPAAAPAKKGSYIDLNQQGKVVSYNPDEFTKTMSARTQNATDSGVVGSVHAGPVGSNYDSMVQGTVQGASATAHTVSTSTRTVSSVDYGSSRLSSTRSTINPRARSNTPSRSSTPHSSHRFSPNSRLGILDDEPMVGNSGRNLRPQTNKSVGTIIGAPTTSSATQSTRTSERTTATSSLKHSETGRATTARPAANPSPRSATKVETLASSNPGVRILRTTTTQPTPKAKPVRPRNEVVYSKGGAVVISQRITADQASTYLNQNHESKESHQPTAPTAIAGSTASLRRTAEQSLNTSFKRLQEDKSISGTIVIRSDPNKRNK